MSGRAMRRHPALFLFAADWTNEVLLAAGWINEVVSVQVRRWWMLWEVVTEKIPV